MNGIRIKKDTFQTLGVDEKLNALFDVAVATHESQCKQVDQCEVRFGKLESRKWKDKGIATGAGIIGGFIAGLAKFVR